MLLYQYACACGQPVISGLPLQLSCKLRRLRFSRCLAGGGASTGVVSTRRQWLSSVRRMQRPPRNVTVQCQDALAYLRALPRQAPRQAIQADPPYIFPGRSMNYYGARRRGHDLVFHSELRDALFASGLPFLVSINDVPEAVLGPRASRGALPPAPSSSPRSSATCARFSISFQPWVSTSAGNLPASPAISRSSTGAPRASSLCRRLTFSREAPRFSASASTAAFSTGQQPLAHGLGRELRVEDALRRGCHLLDQIGLGPRLEEPQPVAKLTLGRCPSEKALGSHRISSEASLCQNSGSHCIRLKKDWSERAKLLEPRPRLQPVRCVGRREASEGRPRGALTQGASARGSEGAREPRRLRARPRQSLRIG